MNLNIISKYRNEIYGFSIIWIVLFHGAAINHVDYSFGYSLLQPMQRFLSLGNVGVDIFLFLSGVCLYFSFAKSQNLYLFAKKRLLRIIPPVLIVYSLYWIVRYGVFASDPVGVVSRLMLMRFWLTGDQTIYFASLMLVLYFFYPYIYAFLFSGKRSGLRFVVLMIAAYIAVVTISLVDPKWYSLTEIALTRIPVFILGSYFGKWVYEGKVVGRVFVPVALIGSVAFFAILDADILSGPMKRFFYLVGGVSLSYTFALLMYVLDNRMRCSADCPPLLHRFLSFFGAFSFELYLAHIMINQILRMLPLYQKGDLLQYLAIAVISCFVAFAAHKVTDALAKKALARR